MESAIWNPVLNHYATSHSCESILKRNISGFRVRMLLYLSSRESIEALGQSGSGKERSGQLEYNLRGGASRIW